MRIARGQGFVCFQDYVYSVRKMFEPMLCDNCNEHKLLYYQNRDCLCKQCCDKNDGIVRTDSASDRPILGMTTTLLAGVLIEDREMGDIGEMVRIIKRMKQSGSTNADIIQHLHRHEDALEVGAYDGKLLRIIEAQFRGGNKLKNVFAEPFEEITGEK